MLLLLLLRLSCRERICGLCSLLLLLLLLLQEGLAVVPRRLLEEKFLLMDDELQVDQELQECLERKQQQ